MTDKLVNKVLEYIDTIGGIISEGAKQGYVILVRQQFSMGFVYILTAIVVIVLVGVLIRITYKCYKKHEDDRNNEWTGGLVAASIIGSLITVGMVVLLGNGILHIVNPQYYAIQEILDTLK